MRTLSAIVLTLGLTVQAVPQGTRHVDVLAALREALGGEARLSSIRTFVAKGVITRGTEKSASYGTFEIACELPSKFVQSWAVTLLSSTGGRSIDRGVLGFNEQGLIYQANDAVSGLPRLITAEEARNLLRRAQRDFVKFTLPMFASSFPGAPVTFADMKDLRWVITATGSGVTRALTVDSTRHLTIRFGNDLYSDYRSEDGWNVPHTIRSSGETWEIKTLLVNVAIPAKTFR